MNAPPAHPAHREVGTSPGLAARLAATAACLTAVAGFGFIQLSPRVLTTSWDGALLAIVACGWPPFLLFARRRSWLTAGISVSAFYLLPAAIFATHVPFGQRFVFVALWIATSAVALALLDSESHDDQPRLAPQPHTATPTPTSTVDPGIRLYSGGATLATVLLLALVVPLIVPHRSQKSAASSAEDSARRPSTKGPLTNGPTTSPVDGYQNWHNTLRLDRSAPPKTGVVATLSGPPVDRVRAIVFDRYRDGVWACTTAPAQKNALGQTNRFSIPGSPTITTTTGWAKLTWDLTIEATGVQVLLAPFEPLEVEIKAEARATFAAHTTQLGAVQFVPDVPRGTVMTITAQKWNGVPADLATISASVNLPSGAEDYRDASSLDSNASTAVAVARAAVVQGGATTGIADRVAAVEAYLHGNTTRQAANSAANLADATNARQSDPISAYLDGVPGTQSEVETAAILLLRSAGVSARLVSGFEVRTRADGLREIRAEDQGIWPEIWYGPTAGWRPWDPAAVVPLAAGTDGASTHQPSGTVRLVLIVLGGLAITGLTALLIRRSLRSRRRRDGDVWAVTMLRQLEHDGQLYQHPRPANQTVLAYAGALAGRTLPDPDLERVGRILTAELYAPTSDPGDRTIAESIVKRASAAAAAEMKQRRRSRRQATLAAMNPRSWPGRFRRCSRR